MSIKPDKLLVVADKELGKAQAALNKVILALDEHGERENMLAHVRALSEILRLFYPINQDASDLRELTHK